jgi:hypothetical protein
LRALDPKARIGFRGSSATGKVGNETKLNFGDPINLEDFDIDIFVVSDTLVNQFGDKVIPAAGLRSYLYKTNPLLFEGLRPGGKGVSLKIHRSTKDLGEGAVFFDDL